MSTQISRKRRNELNGHIASGTAFCVYCGLFMHHTDCKCVPDCLRRGSYDHVIPQSLGGGNMRKNLVYACVGCNRKKAGKPLEQFVELPARKTFTKGLLNRHGIPILRSSDQRGKP